MTMLKLETTKQINELKNDEFLRGIIKMILSIKDEKVQEAFLSSITYTDEKGNKVKYFSNI